MSKRCGVLLHADHGIVLAALELTLGRGLTVMNAAPALTVLCIAGSQMISVQ